MNARSLVRSRVFTSRNYVRLKYFLCAGCDKKFTSKFKLKRHVLIHSQTKTFLCDICKRAFRRKDHLKNHEKVEQSTEYTD